MLVFPAPLVLYILKFRIHLLMSFTLGITHLSDTAPVPKKVPKEQSNNPFSLMQLSIIYHKSPIPKQKRNGTTSSNIAEVFWFS